MAGLHPQHTAASNFYSARQSNQCLGACQALLPRPSHLCESAPATPAHLGWQHAGGVCAGRAAAGRLHCYERRDGAVLVLHIRACYFGLQSVPG